MKARTVWNGRLQFTGDCEGHSVKMDAKAPLGENSALTPKELVAIAAAGCTGMDVAALMKKYGQPVEKFEIQVDAPVEYSQPPVFKEINLVFLFEGKLDPEKAIEAVRLSQTRYCAVSAMLSKALPIHYNIFLNGTEIGSGSSSF